MPRYRLVLAYDGSDFEGWQTQASARTVQRTVCEALRKMTREKVEIHGASRTDAGVHAYGQVAHFDLSRDLPLRALCEGVNSLLPPDVRVRRAEEVAPSFDARKSARCKIYSYYLLTSRTPDPLLRRFTLHWPRPLAVERLNKAARRLVGEHDFSAFQGSGSGVKGAVRELHFIRFRRLRPYLYRMDICANGFLRHMVRNIVGTLLEVNSGRFGEADMTRILQSRDRRKAGPTAPPQGLLLRKIFY